MTSIRLALGVYNLNSLMDVLLTHVVLKIWVGLKQCSVPIKAKGFLNFPAIFPKLRTVFLPYFNIYSWSNQKGNFKTYFWVFKLKVFLIWRSEFQNVKIARKYTPTRRLFCVSNWFYSINILDRLLFVWDKV